jgi:excisionase family DNA binding protein
MKSLQVIQTTSDQLVDLIKEGIRSQLKEYHEKTQSDALSNEILTRQQACEYLQVDSSTLWHWTNKGKIKAYGISNRRYYKRSELLSSLVQIKN